MNKLRQVIRNEEDWLAFYAVVERERDYNGHKLTSYYDVVLAGTVPDSFPFIAEARAMSLTSHLAYLISFVTRQDVDELAQEFGAAVT